MAALAGGADATTTFQDPQAFVQQVFAGKPPSPQTVWLVGTLGERAAQILGHPPNRLRERYWQRGNRTAWILEEIGKERPITVGWVVEQGRIVRTRVLIYRESRGWEVRYPYFTNQFQGARLQSGTTLSRQIDGITGATLSVAAMRRMARLALLLHEHVSTDGPS